MYKTIFKLYNTIINKKNNDLKKLTKISKSISDIFQLCYCYLSELHRYGSISECMNHDSRKKNLSLTSKNFYPNTGPDIELVNIMIIVVAPCLVKKIYFPICILIRFYDKYIQAYTSYFIP